MRQVLFSYAFRPFFLLAGLSGIGFVALWVMSLNGQASLPTGISPIHWHGHEMIVGFAMATVAGFALSAVATWTGRPAVEGIAVWWLAMCWIAGRIAIFYVHLLHPFAVVALDMLFPLSLSFFFAREVIGARNQRNYKVVAIVVTLAVLNFTFHTVAANQSLYLLIHTMLLLVALIGGRIIPNFTANWLRGQGADRLPANNQAVDRIAIALTILVGAAVVASPSQVLVGSLALSAAAVHAIRVSRWQSLQTVSNPLLFILHVAYWWIPIGYAMTGLANLGLFVTPTAALHALTMGAIGGMVFAMITRVPLGHTGRALHASRLTAVAYILLTSAVLVRILSPWMAGAYLPMVNLAAVSWCLAFAIFMWVYWPILTREPLEAG